MSKVKITTFIPVYNMADTVERAILSVLNQDYENKELIVLDGGSTDGTVEVIEKYLDRIAYFASGLDGGSSKAIAMNLAYATGDIVGMIGADDWYNPGALSAAARTYEESHGDVLYGDVTIKELNGTSRRASYAEISLDKMYECCAIHTIASFVKRELLAEHDKFYFEHHEGVLKITTDHYLWLRLYCAGRRFVYIPSEMPITNFALTGVSSRRIYQVLIESKKVLELVVGPENSENARYYRAYERRFATFCIPFYVKLMESDNLDLTKRVQVDRTRDYILFGAGDVGQKFYAALQYFGCRVRYFADNYPERTGGSYMGLPVRSPEALLSERNAVLLISTVNYDEEIFRQLQAMDLDPSVVVMTHNDFSVKIYESLGREVLDDGWRRGLIQ